MRRTTAHLIAVVALTTLVAGCGGDDEDPVAATTEEESTSAPASPSASATPTTSALPPGCEAPKKAVEYTSGSATLDVTAGPDQGQYELGLDPSQNNAYASSDREITGNWLSADEQAVLFIDIEGTDPCKPDAFTSIGTKGAAGPLFVDSFHTGCDVEVTSLSEAGVQGTFTCTGLTDFTGQAEGQERDAQGTFTLLP